MTPAMGIGDTMIPTASGSTSPSTCSMLEC
jgi:hypothetical protein